MRVVVKRFRDNILLADGWADIVVVVYDSKAHKIHVGKDIENETGNKINEKNSVSVTVNDNIIENLFYN